MHLRTGLLLLLAILSAHPASAEPDMLVDTVERFIRQQTQGIPGQIRFSVTRPDLARLPACSAYEAYLPAGARLSGKTHVGVRCLGPAIWSALVQVQITIQGSYVTTVRPVVAGQTITAADIALVNGDLGTLPAGVIGDPQNAIGKTLRNSLGSGQPLRADQLLSPLVIRQGQTVRVISAGPGFAVTAEGKALNNAAEGQLAQIRMQSGQTITGTAKADGSVEVAF